MVSGRGEGASGEEVSFLLGSDYWKFDHALVSVLAIYLGLDVYFFFLFWWSWGYKGGGVYPGGLRSECDGVHYVKFQIITKNIMLEKIYTVFLTLLLQCASSLRCRNWFYILLSVI